MRKIKSLLIGVFISFATLSSAEANGIDSIITLNKYMEVSPQCLTQEIIYDGCTLLLNSDGEFLFGQFNVLHPELQMRILMQGITFYIDPTGRKKEKFALHFPNGASAQSSMSQPSVRAGASESDNVLPDISPLIQVLSSQGVTFDINGKQQDFNPQWSTISLDVENHCLSYSFIVPIEQMLSEKKLSENWKIGIFSEGGKPDSNGPGMGGPGMGGPGMGGPGMGGPGMGGLGMQNEMSATSDFNNKKEKGGNKQDLRQIMMKDIEVWIPFSYAQICSLN